jgi:hypothetical protein
MIPNSPYTGTSLSALLGGSTPAAHITSSIGHPAQGHGELRTRRHL